MTYQVFCLAPNCQKMLDEDTEIVCADQACQRYLHAGSSTMDETVLRTLARSYHDDVKRIHNEYRYYLKSTLVHYQYQLATINEEGPHDMSIDTQSKFQTIFIHDDEPECSANQPDSSTRS